MLTPHPTHLDMDALRAEFPILHRPLPDGQKLVYLDSAATSQRPRRVLAKLMECYEQYNANAHRGIHPLGSRVTEEVEAAREKLRAFIGAESADEIIFTSGTTESINLVAQAWGRTNLAAGDEVILNEMEHHSCLVPWQQISAERGAVLKFIPLTPDGRLSLDGLDAILSSRTKMVAVTGMSNVLGTINPVDEIARRARAHGALVMVDGAQSVPHRPTNVKEMGADFLAFSGHKMFGPTGIGVLYGRRELLAAMSPYKGGGNMIRRVWKDGFEPGDLPAKFEAGTMPIAEAIALGAAVDYIGQVGMETIVAREHQLTRHALTLLTGIKGLRVLGPALELRGGLVSFVIDGIHPQDLSEVMDHCGVCIRVGHHCTMPLHDHLKIPASARASFAVFNTDEEVEVLVEAVNKALKLLRR
jgi:cysteine desulfurase/selenocysteine lyase